MRRIVSMTLFLSVIALPAFADDGWRELFDGKTLEGWERVNGTAPYAVKNGEIVGTAVVNSPNSFLATRDTFGDFILEFEVKVDSPLNSGVQFRSLSTESYRNNRVHGYQFEIDPSERCWTGGIYDEARSKWLYPLSSNEAGRKAFRHGDWNQMRIEAIGTRIRTWVNGVPTASVVDNQTAEGFIALQVHSIGNRLDEAGKQVRWRNIRIKQDGLDDESWYVGDAIEEYNYIPNHLTARQKAEGWKLLWDGKTTAGWRGAKLEGFPARGWEIKDGVLSVLSSGGGEARNGGDIVTLEEFSNFELEVDFKITPGANSGIKYFVDPDLLKGDGSAIGLEFQILDDDLHPDAKMGTAGNRTVASLYDLIPATNLTDPRSKKSFNGVYVWNRARIVVRDGLVEHWLNGQKMVEYDRFSQMFRALVARSKYAEWTNFGEWPTGPILLQDHGDLVHFRSIKIKVLDEPDGE